MSDMPRTVDRSRASEVSTNRASVADNDRGHRRQDHFRISQLSINGFAADHAIGSNVVWINAQMKGALKAETYNECHTYAKTLHHARDKKLDLFADELATLGLDLLVADAG
jgi:hypothetical protein